MAEGRSNAAIAATLVVSERAVEKHVGNIFSKLGLAAVETPTTAGCSPCCATWGPTGGTADTNRKGPFTHAPICRSAAFVVLVQLRLAHAW